MTNENLAEPQDSYLKVGDKVEIKNKFDGDWSGGYVISKIDGDHYYVTRSSEEVEIPYYFTQDHIRKSKKRSMWWI